MTIAVVGAGAGIGRETVALALARGHHVLALSPSASTLADHPRLTKVSGSATNPGDLQKAMQFADVLLITVGTKAKKGTTLFSDIAKALIAVAQETGYHNPILIITGFGAGDSERYLGWFMKAVIHLFLKDQYQDKTRMEELITRSQLNWEIIRPGILTNQADARPYQLFPALRRGMKVGRISRKAVATYLIDEAERRDYLGQQVTLT
ncbi:NAD(P)H-binding protein [Spirosoma sp.]|uniref:NAD(P)-dependent oxidoreductase n=1 Tax=Spirosoma sp. TaxID=1899569 RepID=UPI00260ECBD4|nr:NAD(P)H-binding protein [Spirosoma sp.]MCX6215294.1 NAD(P)H-binding protein [Spirosoma sp.]